jgi:adrenodoxin-NADP+ reductase
LYVSGWIKTGPVGVIASTMYEAQETAESLIRDYQDNLISRDDLPGSSRLPIKVLDKRVTFKDWKKIDVHEINVGLAKKKIREKVVDVKSMLEIVKTQ